MRSLTPAPDGYPIKLVRDNTGEILNASGEPGDLWYAPLRPSEVLPWLRKKLIEECAEYVAEPGLAELGDVLTVVEALATWEGSSLETLIAQEHEDPRGGFLAGQMMYGRHHEFDDLETA